MTIDVDELKSRIAMRRAERDEVNAQIESLKAHARNISDEIVILENQVPVVPPKGNDIRVTTKL